jgi:hypothetical protein
MCWGASTTFSGDQLLPGLGRRFGAQQLAAALSDVPGRDDLIDDAIIVVSELLTNSVRAGSKLARLSLSLHRDVLRVLVDDVAPGKPIPRHPDDDEAAGRGLAIVAALSSAWSTEVLIPGKQVWAELELDPALTADLPSCNRPIRVPAKVATSRDAAAGFSGTEEGQ